MGITLWNVVLGLLVLIVYMFVMKKPSKDGFYCGYLSASFNLVLFMITFLFQLV